MLRVSMSSAERFLEPQQGAAKTARALFLDRDTSGLEALAGELERPGSRRSSPLPREVSFFLRLPTPASSPR
jgi:hypothetical protein